jgi:hypothetical protein
VGNLNPTKYDKNQENFHKMSQLLVSEARSEANQILMKDEWISDVVAAVFTSQLCSLKIHK